MSTLPGTLTSLDISGASTLPAGGAFLPSSGGESTFWTGVGGPALIVVFVAIGVLCVLVALVLMVRHRHMQLLAAYEGEGEEIDYGPLTVRRLRKRPKLGPKPRIFELPVAYEKEGLSQESVASWNGIVPLAATVLFVDRPEKPWPRDSEKSALSSPTNSNASPSCQSPLPSPLPLVYPTPDPIAPGSFAWRHLRRSPSRESTSSEPAHTAVPETMQVAVAIAMPCPSLRSSCRSRPASVASSGSANRVPVPELCLGFAQVPGVDEERWRELHAAAVQTEKEEKEEH